MSEFCGSWLQAAPELAWAPGAWAAGPRRRKSLASQPASRVIAAATQKDRIDADIQLAGVKPMSRPNDVYAEAHQDTYPGLMSWYVTNPAAHGSSISQREGAAGDRSQRRREMTK